MGAIDNEILAMFNALNPARQGQLLDVLGRLTQEQHAEQRVAQQAEQHAQQNANKPAAH